MAKDKTCKAVEQYQTRFWAKRLSGDNDAAKIVVACERTGSEKFPYLLILDENVNADHWFGGRRRFGHGHQVKFEYLYFNPSGNGEFLAGEELRWLPHYMDYNQWGIAEFQLGAKVIDFIESLPVKDLFGKLAEPLTPAPDERVVKAAGAQLEALFEHYQDPKILAEEREAILAEYKKTAELHSHWRTAEESKPYEPTFDLSGKLPFDRIKYTLGLIKRASGFDLYAQPEQIGDSHEGMMSGMFGLAPFPGPIDFLQGKDKEDYVGQPGNTGLNLPPCITGIEGVNRDLYIPKTETHNTPQAIDPFGFSTGIDGVKRDPVPFEFPRIVGFMVPDDLDPNAPDLGKSGKKK